MAATSLVSTVVICLQIWRHTTLSSQSRKHYRTIINTLIESSATYTIASIILAIFDFTSTGKIEGSFTIMLIENFVEGTTVILSGLAPTLMIARLFLSSGQEDTEVSSARLPSELFSHAFHAPGTQIANISGADLEMQQIRGSIVVGEQENDEIQAIPRNEDHGQVPTRR
ncbi:hypothetical protein CPC08DRAFT_491828 [Agrocybe pediades]|nr:hypothetical protein CPC08DRAFT_491828 [Agrocybe pediades]